MFRSVFQQCLSCWLVCDLNTIRKGFLDIGIGFLAFWGQSFEIPSESPTYFKQLHGENYCLVDSYQPMTRCVKQDSRWTLYSCFVGDWPHQRRHWNSPSRSGLWCTLPQDLICISTGLHFHFVSISLQHCLRISIMVFIIRVTSNILLKVEWQHPSCRLGKSGTTSCSTVMWS